MIRRFARPYAKAIFEVSGSPEKADAIRGELASFEDVRKRAADLQGMYANPGIEFEAKMKVTGAIAGRLGLSEMAMKVLEVLIRNHRINDLAAIVEGVAVMVRDATGRVEVEVRSAHRLNEQELAELRRTMEKKAGRKVDLEVTTDPELLGGFVARIGSEIYDASAVGKIEKFRTSLMS
jgi:F-type H+-transporting ATPase subunit delta